MASARQHGYSYDLFASYSSGCAAWVSQFLADLVRDVDEFIRPPITPFFDAYRLEPGFKWSEALLESAADSALFLPVLTPAYFQSEYCQKEVNSFLASGVHSTTAHRSRILPIRLLCAAPKDHPLAAFQATAFCSVKPNNIPMEFEIGSPQYKEARRKLAVSIANLLATVPPKGQKRPAIYLAAPQPRGLLDSLVHTYDVVPSEAQALFSLPQSDLEETLDGDLNRAFVSVHTLPDAPMAKPLIDAQLAAARKLAKPRLIFAPKAPTDLLNEGFEWLTSQSDLEDRIRRLAEKPPTLERKQGDHEPLIYFVCPDRPNKSIAEPLLAHLEAKRIRVYPSPLDGPADQALQTHVQALDELDGCLIYYGNAGRGWFDSVFLRLARKIRQRGLPSAIFLTDPEIEQKRKDLSNLGVPLVEDASSAASVFLGAPLGAHA